MRYGKGLGVILGIFLLSALALAAEPAKERQQVAKVDQDGVQRVEVLAGAYYYNPNLIVVKINVPVELKIKTEGGLAPHDIVLNAPEAGINFKQELSSEPQLIRFTPTRTGRYKFDCTKKFLFFESHKERGMYGTIVVVE